MAKVKVTVSELSLKKSDSVLVRTNGGNKVTEIFGDGTAQVWTEHGKTFDREINL